MSRYQKRGFVFGYISHYEGMETGDIVARVVEGRVNKVNVVHVDDEGNPRKTQGEVSPAIILRELPFRVSCPRLLHPFQVLVSKRIVRHSCWDSPTHHI